MNSKKTFGMTEGPLYRSIIGYFIPLLLASLISVLFHAADIAVLGNFSDQNSVAAVGATGSIVTLIVNSAISIASGTNVMVSRYIGEKNKAKTELAVNTSLVFALAMGIISMVIGISLSSAFLRMTNCPEEIIHDADVYLKYYFIGAPAILVYNFGASIIRSSGDAKKPLIYLSVSGITNVVLNFILCMVLAKKVVAVALATLISQLVGAILVVVHLMTVKSECRFDIKRLNFSFPELKRILAIGVPNAINTSLFAISNLQIASYRNSFGPACIAGDSAAVNLESLLGTVNSSFSTTAIVFLSQNYGARKLDRIKRTLLYIFVTDFVAIVMMSAFLLTFGEPILSLIIPGEFEAMEYALVRATYLVGGYFIIVPKTVADAVLQSNGKSFYAMAASVVMILVVRLIWMELVFPLFPFYSNILQCYIVTWVLSCISAVALAIVIYVRSMNELKAMDFSYT